MNKSFGDTQLCSCTIYRTYCSSGCAQLPTQKYIRWYSQYNKDNDECDNVQCKTGIGHIELGQRCVGRTEMAVRLMAFQFLATIWIGGQGSALEAISNVWEIGDPAQVNRYGVERHEEAGEQQEWHRHDRGQEDAILHIHCGADDQADTLRDERYQQAGAQEHEEPEPLQRLRCEVIYDRYVQYAEYGLEWNT